MEGRSNMARLATGGYGHGHDLQNRVQRIHYRCGTRLANGNLEVFDFALCVRANACLFIAIKKARLVSGLDATV